MRLTMKLLKKIFQHSGWTLALIRLRVLLEIWALVRVLIILFLVMGLILLPALKANLSPMECVLYWEKKLRSWSEENTSP